jgi:LacI family transcriptional regulator
MADLAREAGVGVATVDRVLSGRAKVREGTAERVLKAADALGFHARGLIRQRLEAEAPKRIFGFLLRQASNAFYQDLAAKLTQATQAAAGIRGRAVVEFIDDFEPARIAAHMRRLAERADMLAVVSVDHPHISEEVEQLNAQGIGTFALLSDLTAPSRAGYVGLDARKAGRTVAWAISRLARRPGKVGFVLGSHRYLDHDTREMSFRSYFRELAPAFQLLEPQVNSENVSVAYDATVALLKRHPDLVGLYDAGGGVPGTIQALRDEGAGDRVVFVCNELTPAARAGLIDGVVDFVIETPTAQLAARAIDAMCQRSLNGASHAAAQIHVPFDLYVSENI